MDKYVFIIDLDHTLIFFDEEGKYTDEKLYYVRPYAKELLEGLRSLNPKNLLVLWTAATNPYVYDVLYKTPIGPYFDHVFRREHCEESMKRYNLLKSARYVQKLMGDPEDYLWILIDDNAAVNGKDTYDEIIEVNKYLPDLKGDDTLLKILIEKSIPTIRRFYPHILNPIV